MSDLSCLDSTPTGGAIGPEGSLGTENAGHPKMTGVDLLVPQSLLSRASRAPTPEVLE